MQFVLAPVCQFASKMAQLQSVVFELFIMTILRPNELELAHGPHSLALPPRTGSVPFFTAMARMLQGKTILPASAGYAFLSGGLLQQCVDTVLADVGLCPPYQAKQGLAVGPARGGLDVVNDTGISCILGQEDIASVTSLDTLLGKAGCEQRLSSWVDAHVSSELLTQQECGLTKKPLSAARRRHRTTFLAAAEAAPRLNDGISGAHAQFRRFRHLIGLAFPASENKANSEMTLHGLPRLHANATDAAKAARGNRIIDIQRRALLQLSFEMAEGIGRMYSVSGRVNTRKRIPVVPAGKTNVRMVSVGRKAAASMYKQYVDPGVVSVQKLQLDTERMHAQG